MLENITEIFFGLSGISFITSAKLSYLKSKFYSNNLNSLEGCKVYDFELLKSPKDIAKKQNFALKAKLPYDL